MEWPDPLALDLVTEVREEPAIWNPNHPDKKNRRKNSDAWKRILSKPAFAGFEVKDIIEKWKNLCQSYRGYRRKIIDSIRSGMRGNDVYKPVWFAFNDMDAFMNDTYSPINTRNMGHGDDEESSDNENELSASQRDRINEEMIDDPPPASNEDHEISENTTASTGNDNVQGEDNVQQPSTSSNVTSKNSPLKAKVFKSPRKVKQVYQRLKQQHAPKKMSQQDAMNVACNYLKMKTDQVKRSPEPVVKSSTSENNQNNTDMCGLFGLLTAEKLRKIAPEKQALVMHEIDGVMLKYISGPVSPASSTSISPRPYRSNVNATSPYSQMSDTSFSLYPLSPASPSSSFWTNSLLSSPSHSNNSTPTYMSDSGISDPFHIN